MSITHLQPTFAGGEISPRLGARVDLAKYHTAAAAIENFIVRPEGGLIRRPGTRFAGAAKFASKLCRLVPFQFSSVQAYVLEFGDAYLRVWKDHGQVEVEPGTPYEIATPYAESHIATLAFAQSADVLYIAHAAHAPRKLARTGHTAWTLSTYQPADGPFLERNTDVSKTIAASGETGTITLTSSAPLFEPGHVGALWWLQMPDLAAVSPWESDVTAPAVNSYCRYNGNYYKALTIGSSNKTGTVPPTHDEGAGYDGIGTKNVRWEFQHKGSGVVRITGYLGPTSATGTVMKKLPHTAVGAATSKWAEGAWSSVRGWPAAVSFHEQRLIWANTPTRPQTIWASASGDYERMEAGTRDDDAFTYGIASAQVNAIRWLASGAALIVGTMGQEFAAGAGALGDPLTPSSVRFVPQSGEGAAAVEPARLGSETLFVNRAGRKVLALLYSVDADAYVPVDLLQLAEHLTTANATIAALAWARAPLNTLWAVRSDGALLSLTYRREEQVYAWARHPRDGAVESIAVIPAPGAAADELWLVTRRDVNGGTVRHVEFMDQPFEPANANDKTAMPYLDAALTYDGAGASVFSGLGHLEGRTVKIIANGALHPDRTVTGGAITLEAPATTARVGLAYTSRLKTLRLEGSAIGTAQGKPKRIASVTVRVLNSMGAKAGTTETTMEDLIRRDASDPTDASPPLRSGDFDVALASDYDTEGQVTIVQDEPLPLDILAVMPQMT